jgi:hypothetical protein
MTRLMFIYPFNYFLFTTKRAFTLFNYFLINSEYIYSLESMSLTQLVGYYIIYEVLSPIIPFIHLKGKIS